MRKRCAKCEEVKSYSDFHKRKELESGVTSHCRRCINIASAKRRRSKDGLISRIYHDEVRSSKKRGHPPPSYTLSQLRSFILDDGNYDKIYAGWVDSGFEKDLIPSIDRLSSLKPYALDNLQLVTFGENHRNQAAERREGKDTRVTRPVNKLTKEGAFIEVIASVNMAARIANVQAVRICQVCSGSRNSIGGYKWEYV